MRHSNITQFKVGKNLYSITRRTMKWATGRLMELKDKSYRAYESDAGLVLLRDYKENVDGEIIITTGLTAYSQGLQYRMHINEDDIDDTRLKGICNRFLKTIAAWKKDTCC